MYDGNELPELGDNDAGDSDARACAELQRRRAESHERALLEINNAIISTLSPDRLLQALEESLKRIMPFDLAALTVYEHDTGTLRVRAQHGQVKTAHVGVGQTADRTNSHTGWVFEQEGAGLSADHAAVGPDIALPSQRRALLLYKALMCCFKFSGKPTATRREFLTRRPDGYEAASETERRV